MNKRAVRRDCFTRIKALTSQEKSAHSEAIVNLLKSCPALQSAEWVFTYQAMPGEPDLAALFDAFPEKRWAFSRVGADDLISFHEIKSMAELKESAFGFLEPDPDTSPVAAPGAADLILIPGVGFDPGNCARIGRGKGHYDRFLPGALTGASPASLIGVCFQTQLTDLEPEPHDIPMSAVITEEGWYPSDTRLAS